MSKSRSKGYIYGTPICIKGGGGSRTIGIPDPLGTHKRRATARRPRAAKRRGLHPARAAGCDIYATLYPQCNSIPFPAPGPRSGPEEAESRAAAHNLCASGAQPAHNLCVYNAGAPATICRIDISRSVDLAS
jgi:hypothetical protein